MAFLFKSKVKSPQDLVKSIRDSFLKLDLLLDSLLIYPSQSTLIDIKAVDLILEKIKNSTALYPPPFQLYFMRNFPSQLLGQLEGDERKLLDKLNEDFSKGLASMKAIFTGDSGGNPYL